MSSDPKHGGLSRFLLPGAAMLLGLLWVVFRPGTEPPILMELAVRPRGGKAFGADATADARRINPGGEFSVTFKPDAPAYGLIYMINTVDSPLELWPKIEGAWPELPPGKQTVAPGGDDWFIADVRPGEITLLIAWSRSPIRKRASLWPGICRICETGAKTRDEKIETIRLQIADIADGVHIISFRSDPPDATP